MSLVSSLQAAFTRIATEFNTVRTEIAGSSGTGTSISALPVMSLPPDPSDVFVIVDTSGAVTDQVAARLVNVGTIGVNAGAKIANQPF